MSDVFYDNVNGNEYVDKIVEILKERAEKKQELTYVLSKPLLEFDGSEYKNGILILIRGYKIILLGTSESNDEFQDFCLDVQDDVSYFSINYEYKNRIGRTREWWNDVVVEQKKINIEKDLFLNFIDTCKIDNLNLERKTNLVIGLLTGSINNKIDTLELETPVDILSAVKNKIMLFDGDQTNFIFNKNIKKRILIQGLAGTGKTELLLHKIRELYTEKNVDNKICFTCFNKVLAKELKNRVPKFFDSMKVVEQIKWNEKLFLFSSWGSKNDKYSGLYSYLCSYYQLPFMGWSYDTEFKDVCKSLLNDLNKKDGFEPCFDYIFIDEGQDFTNDFFELCEKVCKKTVYIAMDVFQNIFMHSETFKISPDYALSKCYRTDPKTLIISHAMGLALKESKPRLGWLDKKGWKTCGYTYEENNGIASISRKPLNRFGEENYENHFPINLIKVNNNNYIEKITYIIDEIKNTYINVKPDDIPIIFLEETKTNYALADNLEHSINVKYNWNVDKGYVYKERLQDHVYISNINNVKGLEFPFVICFSTGSIPKSFKNRNSLYMILSRSFISTYFLFASTNEEFYSIYSSCIKELDEKNYISVEIPNSEEQETMQQNIIQSETTNKTSKEIVEEILREKGIPQNDFQKYHSFVSQYIRNEFDNEQIKFLIDKYYEILQQVK